jgi:hypothetical protein
MGMYKKTTTFLRVGIYYYITPFFKKNEGNQ